ncbi:hypothetical protein QJS10_CPA06g00260 [Acorus calamus]|uniref:Uncharacterized protein n=1 Tax=Acorus calamus TaxID=4465 RepID=A0AAV9EQ45_ACOCL|nr:hypothetical protein QJS10_CPA06g00260 [Acorus calamus]
MTFSLNMSKFMTIIASDPGVAIVLMMCNIDRTVINDRRSDNSAKARLLSNQLEKNRIERRFGRAMKNLCTNSLELRKKTHQELI